MPSFLTTGVTIACFIDDGNVPESSDALTSFISMVVMVVPAAFTSHVGAGPRTHNQLQLQ